MDAPGMIRAQNFWATVEAADGLGKVAIRTDGGGHLDWLFEKGSLR